MKTPSCSMGWIGRSCALLIGLLSSLLVGASARADLLPGQVRLSASGTLVQAPTSNGNDYQLGVDYRYSPDYLYSIGVQKTTRVYGDGSTFTDQSVSASNVMVLAKRVYVDDRITYAPNATFLPLYSVATTPHYVLRSGNELGLGLKYAHYSGQDVGTLAPSYFYAFTDNLVSAVQINFVETYHVILSEQAFLQYSFKIKHRVRVTAATGESGGGSSTRGRLHFGSFIVSLYHFAEIRD